MMREKLAFILWRQEAVRAAPNVAKQRTEGAFAIAGSETRHPYLDHADAIIAALPGLVKQLEWRDVDGGRTYYADSIIGTYGRWDGHFRPPGRPGGLRCENPEAAAQAHYAAAIMAAFGIEGDV